MDSFSESIDKENSSLSQTNQDDNSQNEQRQ